jgi:putative DNA primase/helicase
MSPATRAKPKNTEKPVCRQVTRSLVANVVQALQPMVILPSDVDPPFWIDGEGLFPATELVPFRNALVHLPSVVFGEQADPAAYSIEPTPLLFNIYCLPFCFNPNADEPEEWLKFLESVWPQDQPSVWMLQEWFGYCLLPDTSHHKIAMLIGPPRSGRGTIARVMAALIGHENLAGPRLTALGTNFGLEPLIGKPVGIIGDAQLSGRTDTAPIIEALLSISGEDKLTIDRKHKTAWTGRLPTRLMILANELPKLVNQSGALASRLLVWKFTESFIGREDLGLDAKLAAELPGIFNWAVIGYQRLRERGPFIQAPAGTGLLEQFKDISSPVGIYAKERLEAGPGFQVDTAAVFTDWCSWCDAKRRRSGDDGSFGRQLRSVFPWLETKQRRGDTSAGEKSKVNYYEGLRFRVDSI